MYTYAAAKDLGIGGYVSELGTNCGETLGTSATMKQRLEKEEGGPGSRSLTMFFLCRAARLDLDYKATHINQRCAVLDTESRKTAVPLCSPLSTIEKCSFYLSPRSPSSTAVSGGVAKKNASLFEAPVRTCAPDSAAYV